jgi:flagellar hook assembly protein FlgD
MNVDPLPTEFGLAQNFPNPFNPTTTITYQLPHASDVTLNIFNALGQHVRTLVNGVQEPGFYEQYWDGCDESGQQVSSGIYFYRLTAGEFSRTKRMVLMK